MQHSRQLSLHLKEVPVANNLREALESAAGLLASGKATYLDEQFVRDLLADHPAEPALVVTDEAVEAAAMAVSLDWEKYTASMRTALRAAVPLLGPRPLLDREAVGRIIGDVRALPWDGAVTPHIAAVMKLARPMPTRKRIITALARAEGRTITWQSTEWRRMAEETFGFRADAVLALLNGAES